MRRSGILARVPPPKMHADEIEIDAALVRRLVSAQFPEWAALPTAVVPSWGTDNALYRLGDDKVARLPRHEPTVGRLDQEHRWLLELAPLLPFDVPEPLARGRPAEGYPWEWSIYRWLEGEPATIGRIVDEDRLEADLVELISALQRIDADGGPPPSQLNAFRGEPLALRDEHTRTWIAALTGRIDTAAATTLWETALGAPAWDGPPVWIHGDLDARNLLVRDGRLSGVIDWGCLGVGDPAWDVMVGWKMLSAARRDRFRASLSVDDATWTRARGLTLSQAVGALWYYTLETNPELVREGERWLAELLAP
jgi:aminoglycoside phosphotransferase (APT) family kinase protein